jgi:hypothetical protein
MILSNDDLLIATNHGAIYQFSGELQLLRIFQVDATFVQPPVLLDKYIFLMDSSKKGDFLIACL